ncbi:MAG: PstC family ABC transporter permease [Alkalispirochaetaceae bacterium]
MELPTGSQTAEQTLASLRRKATVSDRVIMVICLFATTLTLTLTFGILYFLLSEASRFFLEPGFDLREFFTATVWQPVAGRIGVLPLVLASIQVVGIAMLFALPLGFLLSFFLYEYASPRLRRGARAFLEVIASVPTVVFGYFALSFVTPALRTIFGAEVVSIYNLLSAGLVVGLLVLPLVASLGLDALMAVPPYLKDGPFGVGARRTQAFLKGILPAAAPDLLVAGLSAASRAIGESVIVSLAAGIGPNLTFNPFESAETMTGYILRIAQGTISRGTIDYSSLFAVGILLFLFTFLLNITSEFIARRGFNRSDR